eukprot:GFYU01003006.1.p1 GENE.GFYU01003006.1~~GFYU01003006.1.p1  ORF type:complete len:180 (-),score=52.00 GFYU01003006.1:198-737(-)
MGQCLSAPAAHWLRAPKRASTKNSDLVLRPLDRGDYNLGFCDVLAQLTTVDNINAGLFTRRFDEIYGKEFYYVVVIEDEVKHKIVGSATLLLEKKFVHGAGLVGHIEDVVVSDQYRGMSLGRTLLEELKTVGEDLGCYKIILDCEEKNISFYEKIGFQRKEMQMAYYVPVEARQSANRK